MGLYFLTGIELLGLNFTYDLITFYWHLINIMSLESEKIEVGRFSYFSQSGIKVNFEGISNIDKQRA